MAVDVNRLVQAFAQDEAVSRWESYRLLKRLFEEQCEIRSGVESTNAEAKGRHGAGNLRVRGQPRVTVARPCNSHHSPFAHPAIGPAVRQAARCPRRADRGQLRAGLNTRASRSLTTPGNGRTRLCSTT